MQPRHEVTIHLTKVQYEDVLKLIYNSVENDALLAQVKASAVFNPLLDERVTVGSSFKRGQG